MKRISLGNAYNPQSSPIRMITRWIHRKVTPYHYWCPISESHQLLGWDYERPPLELLVLKFCYQTRVNLRPDASFWTKIRLIRIILLSTILQANSLNGLVLQSIFLLDSSHHFFTFWISLLQQSYYRAVSKDLWRASTCSSDIWDTNSGIGNTSYSMKPRVDLHDISRAAVWFRSRR